MDIRTLGTKHLAEEALLCHVERREFEEVIHTVLEHHAVTLGALGGVDDIPCFLEAGHSGDFTSYMLALLHSVDHHRSMAYPVRDDVDQVDIRAVTELLPCFLATAVFCSLGQASTGEDLLGLLYPLGVEVTEGLDLYPL